MLKLLLSCGRVSAPAHWLLLAVVALGLLASWLDPGLGAHPNHQHIVRGGTPEQQARALAAHLAARNAAWGESHRLPTARSTVEGGANVVSVSEDGTTLAAPVAAAMPALIGSAQHIEQPALTTTSAVPDSARSAEDVVASVPTGPPRTLIPLTTAA